MKNHLRLSCDSAAGRETERLLRRGTATVELAICLPIIVILVFGSIEVAHFVHLKQDLTICAYEAAKVAAQSGKTAQEVETRFQEIATAKKVDQASITLEPASISELQPGQQIRVIAEAPADSNRIMPLRYFQGRRLKAAVVMVRLQY